MTSIGLITAFDRHLDELFRSANTATKYPPYNLIKSDEESYKFEFAVAGFTKEEINFPSTNVLNWFKSKTILTKEEIF